jgi:hypothetical protein
LLNAQSVTARTAAGAMPLNAFAITFGHRFPAAETY